MAFKAIFKVDGNEYRVVKCDYSLRQEIDHTGRPASVTHGGVVNLEIESTDDTSFFEWMCDSYMKKDATVTFNKRDEDSKMKELQITEAYMVGYGENFDSEGQGAMTQTLKLSANGIEMGSGKHQNEWPV